MSAASIYSPTSIVSIVRNTIGSSRPFREPESLLFQLSIPGSYGSTISKQLAARVGCGLTLSTIEKHEILTLLIPTFIQLHRLCAMNRALGCRDENASVLRPQGFEPRADSKSSSPLEIAPPTASGATRGVRANRPERGGVGVRENRVVGVTPR